MRVKQIIVNLLSNAVKFTPANGTVELVIEKISEDEQVVHIQLKVGDTGIGMSKDFVENGLFVPFSQESNEVTASYAGTGLGLSIAKQLTQLLGATMTVESELGEGTTFSIDFDFEKVSEKEYLETIHLEEKQEEESTENLQGVHILLAEDHPINSEITVRLLEKRGCIVKAVEDGAMCVEEFVQSKIGEYQLILMDIRMPNMNGIEAAKAIRQLDREDGSTIPIIALTANAYTEDVAECKEAGMNSHLAKPIEPKKLYETISRNI